MSEIKNSGPGHPAVGKLHRPKSVEHGAVNHRFRVVEHLPKFDFGPRRGGAKDALRIVREPHGTESIVVAEAFLAGHEAVEA